jgi:serine/threonine protein kinase
VTPPNHASEDEQPRDRWARIAHIFDLLLGGADAKDVFASEKDAQVREQAERLWRHHLHAADESFLEKPIEFEVLPMFQPGQVLANRFQVERLLGTGGMGEVYLAFDSKLGENVALKTIARMLVSSRPVRSRFLAEIQNARRVSHPNVCRIHDLFEESDMVFFAMEYVEGRTLTSVCRDSPPEAAEARRILLQLAQGLHAAHRSGIVHGDFKPSNAMIEPASGRAVIMDFGLARTLEQTGAQPRRGDSMRAGTIEYMAPEILTGAAPSVRGDIFAFGKVAATLLPGRKIWADCSRPSVERRPDSLEGVIRFLEPNTTRRYWLGGGLSVFGGVLVYSLTHDSQSRTLLKAGSRLVVNGFRAAAGAIPGARLARSIILAGIQQSPRIHAVADQDLLPFLRAIAPGGILPVEGETLRKLLIGLRASYWIDAQMTQPGSRYSLTLNLMRAADRQLVAQTAFRDIPAIPALAQAAATWVRRQAAESEQSLAANPAAVTAFTSAVPEALQNYYDAMEHYAVGEMEQAVPLLEEAIRLDGQFAQAHNVLGMCLNSLWRHAEAFQHLERAEELSHRLPERERAWIDTNYGVLVEDPRRMVEAARKNVGYHADEPRYYRILAQVLCHVGDAAGSIPFSRKALELSPQDDLLRNELVVNLCESGQFAEALEEYERARANGTSNPYLNRGAGLAYLGLEKYSDAIRSFDAMAGGNWRLVQGAKILNGDIESAVAGLLQNLAASRAQGNDTEQQQAHECLCGIYFLTDRTDLARQHLQPMSEVPQFPPFAKHLQIAAFWAARLRDMEVLNSAHARLIEIRTAWPNAHTSAVATYADALLARHQGEWAKAEAFLLESLGSAFTVWALFELADLFTATGRIDLADEYWQKFEARRGTVLKLWFTGVLVYAWLNRAIAARLRRDHAVARRYARKVLDHWARENSGTQIVRMARDIETASQFN